MGVVIIFDFTLNSRAQAYRCTDPFGRDRFCSRRVQCLLVIIMYTDILISGENASTLS